MTRDSIHISMSEPLRRANIRPRLQALAEATGLPVAVVAGRALAHGVTYIEGDRSRVFPGAATPTAPIVMSADDPAPTPAPPSAPAMADAPPRITAGDSEPPHAPATPDAPPHAPEQTADTPHTTAPSMGEPPTTDENAEPAPRAKPPELVTTKAAASTLGHGTATAFAQHCKRHPEIRRCARKVGRSLLWDPAKLRALYDQKGWQLKHGRQAAARQR